MESQNDLEENSNTKFTILEYIDYAYDTIQDSECLFAAYIHLFKAFDTDNDKCLFKSVTMGFTIQFTMSNGQVDDT